MRKKTTADVIAEMDRAFEAEERIRREAHESVKGLARDLCDQGLVDDVEGDPAAYAARKAKRKPITFVCGLCGAVLPGDVPDPLFHHRCRR